MNKIYLKTISNRKYETKSSFYFFYGRITVVLLLLLPSYFSFAQYQDSGYLQTIKTNVKLPNRANENIQKLFLLNGKITAVSESGIYRFENGNWKVLNNGVNNWSTATINQSGNIWLATINSIQDEAGKQKIKLPEFAENDSVRCLFWEDNKTLYVGTNKKLLSWNGQWKVEDDINARVNAIEKDAFGNLWVATNAGLWRRSLNKWVNLDETLMDRANLSTYFTLALQNNGKDVLLSTPFSVACISGAGDNWVLRGVDGLPYGPVSVIKTINGVMWFGTDKGAIKKDSAWHYYNGKRWLADDKINDILPIDEKTVWIATPGGISQIQQVEMTLEQKADSIEKIIELRHVRRDIINHSKLQVPGDLSTSIMQNEDNDGLWTSCFLAAECFRFAATKNPDAYKKAVRTFEALERLEKVTGISGYPARSYALATDSVQQSRSPHPKHWHPSPDGKWQWLDDTSSDEIAGHIFTIALFHDLVADEAYKTRSAQLIERILNNIIDNNFVLIDLDGKPTRWGIWNPDSLNFSPNWMYERGLNSLQILSHLKTGIYITGNPKFEKAYNDLIKKHGYAQNAVLAKVTNPFEKSYSDDILNFFPYYNLIKYAGNDPSLPLYLKSLERSWGAVQIDHMPVWNVMTSAMLKRDCGLEDAVSELQGYPMDLVNWTMTNSHRWDLLHDQLVDRGGNQQAVNPLPAPENDVWRWNTNPRKLDSGAAGTKEEDGTFFLFAYWMARYHGFIKK